MFDKNYKRVMDTIIPSDDAVSKTLDSMRKTNSEHKRITKNRFKIIAVACLAIVVVTTSIFAAFKFSDVSEPTQFNGIRKANSYDDINDLVKQSYSKNTYGEEGFGIDLRDWFINNDYALLEEAKPEMDSTAIDSNTKFDTAQNSKDFSDTNNQVSGVQEADIVKTDGKYIYYVTLETKKLFISEINNSEMKLLSSLAVDAGYIHEMLLIDNMLCIISDGISRTTTTECRYYDISNRSYPILKHTLTQDGSYISSRAINTEVYVISNFSKIEKGILNTRTAVIPEINGKKIDADCIWIPEKTQNTRFTIVTAYNTVKGAGDFDSAISVFGASDTLYAGKENLYLTNLLRDNETIDTVTPRYKVDIFRIKLDSNLSITGSCRIPGKILNQFSMDEKDGRLRVATTIDFINVSHDGKNVSFSQDKRVNRVFCLNKEMEIIGQSADMGKSEDIKSVRFIGDIAYVVTFRQTDPLYAVNLSDPTNPTILSELKIDGFSTYMQPFKDNLLLGIGFDANPKTGVQTGLKLTMFDTTDKADIFDISSYILKWTDGNYSSSSATYNHKAVLLSGSKNIIGIPLSIENHSVFYDDGNAVAKYVYSNIYIFLEFDGEKLVETKRVELSPSNNTDDSRGLYIGDYSYVVSSTGIVCLSLDQLNVVSELKFK